MTIETIADMVWALRHAINVEIFDPTERGSNHSFKVDDFKATASANTASGTTVIVSDLRIEQLEPA